MRGDLARQIAIIDAGFAAANARDLGQFNLSLRDIVLLQIGFAQILPGVGQVWIKRQRPVPNPYRSACW